MKNLLCTLVTLYVIVLVLRIVLSWFPTAPGSVVEQINRVLRAATDPLLLPLRRVIPPDGWARSECADPAAVLAGRGPARVAALLRLPVSDGRRRLVTRFPASRAPIS